MPPLYIRPQEAEKVATAKVLAEDVIVDKSTKKFVEPGPGVSGWHFTAGTPLSNISSMVGVKVEELYGVPEPVPEPEPSGETGEPKAKSKKR